MSMDKDKEFCKKSGIDYNIYMDMKEYLISCSNLLVNNIFQTNKNVTIISKKSEVIMWDQVELFGENRFIFDNEIDIQNYGNYHNKDTLSWIKDLIHQNLREISESRGNDVLLIAYGNSLMEDDDLPNIYKILKDQQNKTKMLDVVIRSSGGNLAIPNMLLHQIHNMYERVNFLIPQVAGSAATLLCMGGKELVIHPNARFTPYDPQSISDNVPMNILVKYEKDTIKRAEYKMIIKNTKKVSRGIILKYMIGCSNIDMLLDYKSILSHLKQMFRCKKKYFFALKVTHYFTNYFSHCSHDTLIFYEDLKRLGINVHKPESKLEELMWENEVLLSYLFKNSFNIKIFANTNKHINIFNKVDNNDTQ